MGLEHGSLVFVAVGDSFFVGQVFYCSLTRLMNTDLDAGDAGQVLDNRVIVAAQVDAP